MYWRCSRAQTQERKAIASQWHSAWIRVPRCWMTWPGGEQEASPACIARVVAATLPVRARTSHACIVLGTLEYSFPGEDLDGDEGEQRKGERARPACGPFVGDDDALALDVHTRRGAGRRRQGRCARGRRHLRLRCRWASPTGCTRGPSRRRSGCPPWRRRGSARAPRSCSGRQSPPCSSGRRG